MLCPSSTPLSKAEVLLWKNSRILDVFPCSVVVSSNIHQYQYLYSFPGPAGETSLLVQSPPLQKKMCLTTETSSPPCHHLCSCCTTLKTIKVSDFISKASDLHHTGRPGGGTSYPFDGCVVQVWMLQPAPAGGRAARGWGPAGIRAVGSRAPCCRAAAAGDGSDFQALSQEEKPPGPSAAEATSPDSSASLPLAAACWHPMARTQKVVWGHAAKKSCTGS